MRISVPISIIAFAAASIGGAIVRADRTGTSSSRAAPRAEALPGEGLRTLQVRQYTMAGHIRPLLFWLGRDDIGLARVVWRAGENGARGYELLVGTDPSKAPRALNRWGFIAEEVNGSDGALLALMTGSDEPSYDDAASSATGPMAGSDFRAIRGQVQGGRSAWQTTRMQTPAAFSVHDVDAALDRVHAETASAVRKQAPLPAGARSGFLAALAELIDHGAGQIPDMPEGRQARNERIRYVFGQGTYELRLRDARPAQLELDGRSIQVVRSAFEIKTLATGERTRFDVSFGTEGAYENVPVAAEWQPRWWLKVALRLVTQVPAVARVHPR